MKRTCAVVVVIVCCTVAPVYALYSVNNRGEWPESWPKELESLRKQSRTLVGPMILQRHYAIPFATAKDFESAWPHILKVKAKGAPVMLVSGENFFLGKGRKAGVVVHSPPAGQPEKPVTPYNREAHAGQHWMNTTYIELVVDGDVVDLNRIPLPPDTPIIDKRFDKPANATSKK